jgi:ankyrin repeat protein
LKAVTLKRFLRGGIRLENCAHRADSRLTMKSILVSIVAAVLVVGCGPSMSIHDAARDGNIEAVKQHLDAGTDVNAKDDKGRTPLDLAIDFKRIKTADLLRKTSEELK